jgi:ubiquitin C-terminal hydrolase
MCDKCLKPQPACKQLSIVQPPKLLIVHLKRFDALKQSKLNSHVNFPLQDLNFYPFMQRRDPCSVGNSCDNGVNMISQDLATASSSNVISDECLTDRSRSVSESNESCVNYI